jgi:diacylglycerol kinase (ATP)
MGARAQINLAFSPYFLNNGRRKKRGDAAARIGEPPLSKTMGGSVRIAIIASGLLTGKDARRQMSGVEKRLGREKIDFEVHIAGRHNHAMEIAAGLPLSEFDAVAPMGGDGTNFQVLNGLARAAGPDPPPPLAILPAGRGNSFAKDLGIENMDDALNALARGRLRSVDVCRFFQGPEPYYFINLMGVGFVADVARTSSRLRWLGTAGYVAGVLHRAAALSFYEMELEIDGEVFLEKNCFVEICNSRYTGECNIFHRFISSPKTAMFFCVRHLSWVSHCFYS